MPTAPLGRGESVPILDSEGRSDLVVKDIRETVSQTHDSVSPPPPGTKGVKRRAADMDIELGEASSSTVDANRGSPRAQKGPADIGGEHSADSGRNVRPRIEDAVFLEDIRMENEPGPSQRSRRGGGVKGRRERV